eukprot:7071686-Karenia_brevis.AAC.1
MSPAPLPCHQFRYHVTSAENRVWVEGLVYFLHPETYRPQWLCVAFEQVALAAGPGMGAQHCSAPAATALRASWRTNLNLGPLPDFGC